MKKALIFSIFAFVTMLSIVPIGFALYHSITPWPMYRYDAKHTATTTSTAPSNNSLLWSWSHAFISSEHSTPLVVNGMVIIADAYSGTKIHALDETTGVELWSFTGSYGLIGRMSYLEGRLYACSTYAYDGILYCINVTTGRTSWQRQVTPSRMITTAPTVGNGKVYVGSSDGYMYCYDAYNGTKYWRFQTDGASSIQDSSPAIDGDLVFFGCNNGKVYALNTSETPQPPTLKWTCQITAGQINTSPAIAANRVFVADDSGSTRSIFALDEFATSNNSIVWKYTIGGSASRCSTPAVSGNAVYFVSNLGEMFALKANALGGINYTQGDSIELWAGVPAGSHASDPVCASGKLLVSGGSEIQAFDAVSGGPIWSYTISDLARSEPAIADERVFVQAYPGVYCFGDPFPPVTDNYKVTAGGKTFDVPIITNSTISSFNTTGLETEGKISFGVAGINETTGMCNITIPTDMLGGTYSVAVDGGPPLYLAPTQPLNSTHTALYFTYNNTSPHTIEITGTTYIPEFQPIMIAPLIVAVSVVVLLKSKKIARFR